MMLIPREELLLAVIEGNLIFWAGVVIIALLCHVFHEAVSFTWRAYKSRRLERKMDRILMGKEKFSP